MGMGVVLAAAEMLKNDYVRQAGEASGTNYNEAIAALKQVMPNFNNISYQRKKVLEVIKRDESRSWGDGNLVWCNAVRTKPPVQLGINGRYLPFTINEKEDDYNSSMFGTSHHFLTKSSTENATTAAFDGKTSVYEAFKNSSHSNGIDVSEYRYMFRKALDTTLMVEEIICNKRKRRYNFSEIVEVTKNARMDNESG
eukprot:12051051-Ditylum_brightwellii.AAC.2